MSELHPGIAPLAFLIGTWRGTGRGIYPTIDDFSYEEEVTIGHVGKPFLRYEQRTKRAGTGEPLHTEVGYWRASDDGAELVIAQPTGVTEVLTGPIDGTTVAVASEVVGLAPTAKEVRTTERRITVDGTTMRYTLLMGAVGQDHQLHLEATLTRADG